MRLSILILTALILLAGGASAQPASAGRSERSDAQARCEALAGGAFTDLPEAPTWVISAKFVAATPARVAYCDVEAYVNPTVNFGVWLPASGWNGKVVARGCGGSCGIVAMDFACGALLREGYACVQNDMGHRSSLIDNNWAANNLPGQIDFGFRATHVSTLAGKAILAAYYDQPARLSYFLGCSTGGRQGMVEAERFPDDFDAMVVIAPAPGDADAYEKTRDVMFGLNLRPDQTPILSAADAALVHSAVLAGCDMDDGVRDGVIGDPRSCHFNPASLVCKGDARHGCLSEEQVMVVRKIYASGGQVGDELDWVGMYIRPAATPGKRQERPYAQSRGEPDIIDTFNDWSNPDLRRAAAHGIKIIAVQGWNDQQIDPRVLIDYDDVLTRTMGGPEATGTFFRLFMIPGMEHCTGGAGAYAIDYMGAMDEWRDKGKAPAVLIGAHPKPGVPLDFFSLDLPLLEPSQIAFTRPHFLYPKVAVYSGKGDPDAAASFLAK